MLRVVVDGVASVCRAFASEANTRFAKVAILVLIASWLMIAIIEAAFRAPPPRDHPHRGSFRSVTLHNAP
jgi:hypothetical protein